MIPGKLLSPLLLLFVLSGCASTQLKLQEWQKLPKAHYTIPPYARHLALYKIALDPGHGGNAHITGYKRGVTGKREAVMNLNVARLLKEFLELAGAEVFLTREDDSFVSLQDRADKAGAAGCDLLISLHHNAGRNPEANYSAVFYHLNPDYSPVAMDLARNIYFGLVDALRLPQVLDDGLLTDKIIFPAGFGLLRRASIPAILLESSFYSNRKEEKRLTDLRYNRREAYGIFLGLARWASGGVPATKLMRPTGISVEKRPFIEYELRDGLTERSGRNLAQQLIFANSVTATIDGEKVPVVVSDDRMHVWFKPLSPLANGAHRVRVDLQNMFKNHNFPRVDTLIISAPTDSIDFQIATQYLPADTLARMPISLAVFDADGEVVWDSTQIRLRASRGSIAPALPELAGGRATVYYKADAQMGLVYVTAVTESHADTLLLSLIPPGQIWLLSGAVIDDSTGTPIPGTRVALNDSIFAASDENGVYFFLNPPVGLDTLVVSIDGYGKQSKALAIDSTRSELINFGLHANLDGLLHGEVIILDAAPSDSLATPIYADSARAADVNLAFIRHFADTLRWAGARPVLIRATETAIPVQERIKRVNEIAEGWYLKFGYERWPSDSLLVQVTIYPANKVGEKIANSVVAAFSEIPHARGIVLQNTDVPEVTLTNKTAVQVILRAREPQLADFQKLFSAIVDFMRAEKSERATRAARAVTPGTF